MQFMNPNQAKIVTTAFQPGEAHVLTSAEAELLFVLNLSIQSAMKDTTYTSLSFFWFGFVSNANDFVNVRRFKCIGEAHVCDD